MILYSALVIKLSGPKVDVNWRVETKARNVLVARQLGLGTPFTIITATTPGSMAQVEVVTSDEQILCKYMRDILMAMTQVNFDHL
jgi:hypothetical protein